MVIEIQRTTNLGHNALVQNHDPVSQSHGFHLVMSNINHGHIQLLVQLGDFNSHLQTQKRVEI